MLDGHVLVLNRSWVAVHITPVRRAMNLLYLGLARAVHPTDFSLYDFDAWCGFSMSTDGGSYVQTPTMRIRVPEVILLRVFNGFVRHEVRFSRHSIFERDRNTCQYCGKRFPRTQLTVDHIIPQSRGGGHTWDNLVLACLSCNVGKADRTPDEAGMPLLKRPARPGWLPHFCSRVPDGQLAVWQKFVDTTHWHLTLHE
ncbi:MAG: HNH endonuclease [Candidatus Hydrogenedentes bacterium]|nr:HNH endonuclease [Candidatus Hydrogenedentota bacterium]